MFQRTRTKPQEASATAAPTDAVRALLAPGGALSHYPGPAFVVSETGAVLAGNPPGLDLAARLGIAGKASRPLPFAPGDAGRMTVSVAAGNGTAVFELAATPQPDGVTTLVLARDLTADHALRAALTESRLRFKDLVEVSSDFMWETGTDGSFVYVSPGGAFGYSAEELLARHPDTLIETLASDRSESPFTTREPRTDVELWFRAADGRLVRLVTAAVPLSRNGAWNGARGLCRNITALHEHETELARLRVREQLMAYILRALHDEDDHARILSGAAAAVARGIEAAGSTIFEHDGGTMRAAATFGTVAPLADDVLERLATSPHPIEGAHETGSWIAMATRSRRGPNGVLALFRHADQPDWAEDERQLLAQVARQAGIALADAAHQRALEFESRHDALTGLVNRRSFTERAGERIEAACTAPRPFALAFVDLDNFKGLNDRAGHEKGDEALIHVARLLKAGLGENDFAARLGGDEFAVWLDGKDEAAASAWVASLLAASPELAARTPEGAAPLGMSIGIAVCPAGVPTDLTALTAEADAAMYHVKRRGKSNAHIIPIRAASAARETGATP